MALKTLIVATGNPGKLREFRVLLEGLPFAVTSLAELDIASPEETGDTLLANALLKARHAAVAGASRQGLSSPPAALADDSGLEVDALGGSPGVYSARYATAATGDGVTADAANNAKLVRALAGVLPERRTARYRCVLVLLRAVDATPLIAQGVWEGLILEAPRGSGGFGYDPYFWLPALGCSAAELSAADKNRFSHRGQALRALRALL